MKTVSDLDIGISSIGRALIACEALDSEFNLIDRNSQIFKPGMDDDIAYGRGVSRCALRRSARAQRVLAARRRQCKVDLTARLRRIGQLLDSALALHFEQIDRNFLKSLPSKLKNH